MPKKRSVNPGNEKVCDALVRVYTPRVPQIHFKHEIMSALHAISRQTGCVIRNFHWQTYPQSFHWIELNGSDGPFSLLIEEGAPLAALCRSVPRAGGRLVFLDDPIFAQTAARLLAPFGFMRAAELRMDLTPADRAFVANLSDRHAKDLKYWKPETVGDVIFNFWD